MGKGNGREKEKEEEDKKEKEEEKEEGEEEEEEKKKKMGGKSQFRSFHTSPFYNLLNIYIQVSFTVCLLIQNGFIFTTLINFIRAHSN